MVNRWEGWGLLVWLWLRDWLRIGEVGNVPNGLGDLVAYSFPANAVLHICRRKADVGHRPVGVLCMYICTYIL